MGVGHHNYPLRRSILQPRDVNAIEQLRTAHEATTIDSCGYRCAGGQCLRRQLRRDATPIKKLSQTPAY